MAPVQYTMKKKANNKNWEENKKEKKKTRKTKKWNNYRRGSGVGQPIRLIGCAQHGDNHEQGISLVGHVKKMCRQLPVP